MFYIACLLPEHPPAEQPGLLPLFFGQSSASAISQDKGSVLMPSVARAGVWRREFLLEGVP